MKDETNKAQAPIWYCLRDMLKNKTSQSALTIDNQNLILEAADCIQKLQKENTLLNLTQKYRELQEAMQIVSERLYEIHNPIQIQPRLNAYCLPYGSTMKLGKRTWELFHMQDEHPGWQVWKEITHCCNTPNRTFNPSEVQALIDIGVPFTYPENADESNYMQQHRRAKFPPVME